MIFVVNLSQVTVVVYLFKIRKIIVIAIESFM